MALSSYFVAFISLIALAASEGATWSYTGDHDTKAPADWPSVAPLCGGNSQSPINIIPSEADYDDDLTAFTFTNYDKENPATFYASNAHALKVTFNTSQEMPSISGGGLVGTYRFMQLHIHHGKSSAKGSEHTINAMHYAAELHLVHLNNKYATFEDSLGNSDALAVLGIMIEVGEEDNANFSSLIAAIPEVTEDGSMAEMTGKFPLRACLPEDDLDVYYRYPGSLTTPDCNEIVQWTVLKEPIYWSEAQLQALRTKLLVGGADSDPLLLNFRPVQPLKSRKVKTSMKPVDDGASGVAFSFITMATMLLSALFLM
ncbi:hypothetical protein CAPTEDRAFT_155321 [Capitella teleta]|uniref:Carbonic anhydrase n=1 Tax=Capitella teleta TaxID=283909 RepID=R7V5W2_CAPTE|nr:hypothetical protein CAPTEDRAFT_155321 [Capitella teleta]|eukprot:ELU11711.1 hypothetical protein CAPTEDRAFT_155321 [Capitella teleta]